MMKVVVSTKKDDPASLSALLSALNAEDVSILDNCSSSQEMNELLFTLGYSMHVHRTRRQLSSRVLALASAKLGFDLLGKEDSRVLCISTDDLSQVACIAKASESREDFAVVRRQVFHHG